MTYKEIITTRYDDLTSMCGLERMGSPLRVFEIGLKEPSIDLLRELTEDFTYIGIDPSSDAVDAAMELYPENTFILGDLCDCRRPFQYVSRHPFDLIIMSDIREKLIHLSYSILSPMGVLYIKASDDGMMLCYPDTELLENISSLYRQFSDSDPLCGRKIYNWLMDTGFKDVKHRIAYRTSVETSFRERMGIYESFAKSRLLDKMPANARALMQEYLEELKGEFVLDNFYFVMPKLYFAASNQSEM